MRIKKSNLLLKTFNSLLIDLPTPISISYLWNFGSLLGLCLIIQLITGIFLAMNYSNDISIAFNSVIHILKDVNYGYLLKYTHANGASFFFFCVYIHIARGIYYSGYLNKKLWNVGVLILLIMMLISFIGYVLPWGQMSFWGATVITNFVSAIPYIGNFILEWIWGGFSVGNPTLSRFFSFHYLFPFLLVVLVIIHILFLHENGSSSPLGINPNSDKIRFHNYFIIKDIFGFIFFFILLSIIIFFYPNILGDPENFIKANSLVTPIHIMPEWYFLFAYAILRSIPNKLGGVLGLVFSILILFILPYLHTNKKGTSFSPFIKILFWYFIFNFILLTWIGSKPVEDPYILIGQISSLFYFSFFFFNAIIGLIENYILYEK